MFSKFFGVSSTSQPSTAGEGGVETVIEPSPTAAPSGLFSNTLKVLGNKDTYKKFGSTLSNITSNVIQKLDDERKKLIEETSITSVQGGRDLLLPPWLDFAIETEKQKEIIEKLLDCKMSRKTFLTPPPIDSDYCQEFDNFLIQIAKISLKSDPILEKVRFHLVPRMISEEQFWKNWYFRIVTIRKSYGLPIYTNLEELIKYQEQLINSTSDSGSGNKSDDVTVSTKSPIQQSEIERWEKELQSELESFNINDIGINDNDLLEDEDWESKINMELESNNTDIMTPTVLQIDSDELITSNNDSDIDMELEKELLKIKELEASQEISVESSSSDQNKEQLIKEIENELSQFQKEQEEENKF